MKNKTARISEKITMGQGIGSGIYTAFLFGLTSQFSQTLPCFINCEEVTNG